MESETALVSAFLVGLFGSVHCIGMCGGIVGVLTMGLPASNRPSGLKRLPYLLAYNSGRIGSYVIAGAVVGFLGAGASRYLSPADALTAGRVISGLFMLALGLYIGGWSPALVHLERFGEKLWRRIEPFGRRFLPAKHPLHALGLGLVWGWLPCGLVYSALAFALASGDVMQGAARMAAFGLGTLPMLLAMGAAAHYLVVFTRKPAVRHFAGAVIIAFGVITLVSPGGYLQHGADHGHSMVAHPRNFT
jgi:uncharacterized protein